MYDTTLPLDLIMAQPPLPRHYESDEEDVSESETGHAFSPIDSSRTPGTLDSGIGPEDMAGSVVDRPVFPRLLSPFPSTGKRSRPVSIDTVKRSSSATFMTDSYNMFDHDDDTIIELPSPDSTTPLPSPIFLQPTTYRAPSDPFASPRNSSRSSSPVSSYSDDDSDIFVAEQVTYLEPNARPNLILISPVHGQPSPREASASPDSSSRYSQDQAASFQPSLAETNKDRGRSRHPVRPTRGRVQTSLSGLNTRCCTPNRTEIHEPMSATAVEAPRSMPLRARSMTFSRPQTPFPASTPSPAKRSQQQQRDQAACQPPSVQSTTATFSLFPSVPSHAYPRDDNRHGSFSYTHSAASSEYSLSSSQAPSRPASPSPYSSHAHNRSLSGSLHSVSSSSSAPHPKRSPPKKRSSMVKGPSTFSGYYSSSLRSELETDNVKDPQPADVEPKSKSRGKRSLKHIGRSYSKGESSEFSTAKSIVGFMLRGKRRSVIKTSHA